MIKNNFQTEFKCEICNEILCFLSPGYSKEDIMTLFLEMGWKIALKRIRGKSEYIYFCPVCKHDREKVLEKREISIYN